MDDDTQALLAGHHRRRWEGMSEHYQIQLSAKHGDVVHVLISASPFIDGDGNYGGAVAMITDITAVREAEDIVRSQSMRIQREVDKEGRREKPPAP